MCECSSTPVEFIRICAVDYVHFELYSGGPQCIKGHNNCGNYFKLQLRLYLLQCLTGFQYFNTYIYN